MKNRNLLLTLLLAIMTPWAAMAQGLTEYAFSTGQDQTKWITLSNNATQLLGSGKDDAASSLVNIGFSFPFGNGSYTKFWANSNGILSFNSSPSGARYNQFNITSYTANQPKICGISCDMGTGTNGYVKYELVGQAPNRVLVCEFKLSHSYQSYLDAKVKWQVQLYESDARVVIVYGSVPTNTPTAFQIGMSLSGSDILTINPQNHTAEHSTEPVSAAYIVWPGAYRYYEFERPCCPGPMNLVCTGTTGTINTPVTATLRWQKGFEETQWILEYNTDNDFSETTQVTVDQSELVNGTYTLTGLNHDVTYYIQVKAWCPSCNGGEGAYSDASNTCSFIHILFPKVEDISFSNPTTGSVTASWTAPNTEVTGYKYRYCEYGTDNWTELLSTSATSAVITGLEAGRYYTFEVLAVYPDGESVLTSDYFSTQCYTEDMCQITFELTDACGNGWGGNYIQVVDAITDEVLGSFSNINANGTSGCQTSDCPETETYTLNVCIGRSVRFQYVRLNGSSPRENSWVIKDAYNEILWSQNRPFDNMSRLITINCAPSTCQRPYNLTNENITNHTANFNWTDGEPGQTAWEISYSTDENFDPEEGTIVNVTHENSTIQGLHSATNYYAYIRANCGEEDGKSRWSIDKLSFTTMNPVISTFTKQINGYGNSNGGYYLLASPLADNVEPADIEGMTNGNYDLYYFNQKKELEWRNYEYYHFNFTSGKGYLYAHKEDISLTFTGEAYYGDGTIALNYDTNSDLAGWNLIGNPFANNATLNMPYFRLNTEGTALKTETESTTVEVMEGVFVQASEAGQIATFTQQTRDGQNAPIARANIVLSDSKGKTLDNAIVRFDEGATLGKFQLREGSSTIYFPVEGKDYAIVNASEAGELPLNFKAETSGTYTLSITQEAINLSYLHLIDNMTGDEQDLLANLSYTFDAHTSDYASRFRLLFATGSSIDSDTFSFVNAADNLCIFGIEGQATLQVIDINGRVLISDQFSGSYESKLNMAPGLYLLRLINGSEVKVQKMVIR